jgi:hypothetical protein
MDSSVANLLLFAAAIMLPTLAFWALVRTPRLVDAIGERFRKRRVVATNVPIEQRAADLRRVHRLLVQCPDGTPMVRRVATRDAYDELLRQACAELDVSQELDSFPEGMERNIERLRVEEALRTAGLTIP